MELKALDLEIRQIPTIIFSHQIQTYFHSKLMAVMNINFQQHKQTSLQTILSISVTWNQTQQIRQVQEQSD